MAWVNKDDAAYRIGTEHEKLGYNVNDLTRLDYSKIEQLLKSLHKRFGWEPIMEKDLIIGEDMLSPIKERSDEKACLDRSENGWAECDTGTWRTV